MRGYLQEIYDATSLTTTYLQAGIWHEAIIVVPNSTLKRAIRLWSDTTDVTRCALFIGTEGLYSSRHRQSHLGSPCLINPSRIYRGEAAAAWTCMVSVATYTFAVAYVQKTMKYKAGIQVVS